MSADELREYGLVERDDSEVRNVLSTQKTDVLGLPDEGAPYLIPLSFGYDGDSRLYLRTSSARAAGRWS